MSSIRWRARDRVVSWPDRPDGVPSYPAPRPLAAPLCAVPTRPANSASGIWIRKVVNIASDVDFLHKLFFGAQNKTSRVHVAKNLV